MNSRCIYYVEGPCEEQLVNALKLMPSKLLPGKVKVIFLAQVLDFEDELVRSTDVKQVTDLTHSKSISNFKTDFCKMKTDACRAMLERHKIDVTVLWTTKASDNYSFISQNCEAVKVL